MAVLMEKIKTCFHALTSWYDNLSRAQKFILACIAAFLVVALLSWLTACGKKQVDSAVVGYTEYRGHIYLVFVAGPSMSVVHDPDCICYQVD